MGLPFALTHYIITHVHQYHILSEETHPSALKLCAGLRCDGRHSRLLKKHCNGWMGQAMWAGHSGSSGAAEDILRVGRRYKHATLHLSVL